MQKKRLWRKLVLSKASRGPRLFYSGLLLRSIIELSRILVAFGSSSPFFHEKYCRSLSKSVEDAAIKIFNLGAVHSFTAFSLALSFSPLSRFHSQHTSTSLTLIFCLQWSSKTIKLLRMKKSEIVLKTWEKKLFRWKKMGANFLTGCFSFAPPTKFLAKKKFLVIF